MICETKPYIFSNLSYQEMFKLYSRILKIRLYTNYNTSLKKMGHSIPIIISVISHFYKKELNLTQTL